MRECCPYREARFQGRLLTPTALARRLQSKLWFWYSADFLTVDSSGLVSAALDITGLGRNGSQTDSAKRLTYFPSDSMFGGRRSFGSTSNSGQAFLAAPETVTVYQYFMSCYYKDGVDNSFDVVSYAITGAGSYSFFHLRGENNTAGWRTLNTSRTFYNTGDPYPTKNGYAANQTVLPLPASVIESRAALGRAQLTRIGGSSIESNMNWVGGFRHAIAANQILTEREIALVEGVIAWDDGIQARLRPGHLFANRPPLIGD